MDKRAFLEALLALGSAAGAGGASAASAIIGSGLLERSIRRDLEGTTTSRGLTQRLKEEAGLAKMPHAVVPNFGNAAYIPPNMYSEDKERAVREDIRGLRKMDHPSGQSAANILSSILRMSKSPMGGMVVGEKVNNPMVIAHEVGHGVIQNKGTLGAFLQKNKRAANILYGVGALAGTAAAIAKPEWSTPIGLGIAGLGALTSLPTLISEYRATQKAKEMMSEVQKSNPRMIDPAEIEKGKSALNKALGVYAMKELGMKTGVPLAVTGTLAAFK